MVAGAYPHWRRRRPSAKTRAAVMGVLRAGIEMAAVDLAAEARLASRRVYVALDDLRIRGLVELTDGGKFRRVA
jgi:hypothetical protein